MRHTRNKLPANWRKQQLHMVSAMMAIAIAVFPIPVLAGNCDNPRYASKNPEECLDPDPPPQGQEREFEVTVRFGEETDDLSAGCPASSCVETTFTAVGQVVCSSQVCDFIGDEVSGPVFGIPRSLFNLLAMTSIRGTQIEPERCFDMPWDNHPEQHIFPYDAAGSTKGDIFEFELRSPVVASPDADGRWWAKVKATSHDMAGETRTYGFHFGGICDRNGTKCPALSDVVAPGEYENGWSSAVFGNNTNKRGQPQTCRCTVSSKPSCPDHVDMDPLPRPTARITIEEIE